MSTADGLSDPNIIGCLVIEMEGVEHGAQYTVWINCHRDEDDAGIDQALGYVNLRLLVSLP